MLASHQAHQQDKAALHSYYKVGRTTILALN
jgi:hypothetical protein